MKDEIQKKCFIVKGELKMVEIINKKSSSLTHAPNLKLGESNFKTIMLSDSVYIDKTKFLNKWWSTGDKVTLIVRPRRFLKTSILTMVHEWFSTSNLEFSFGGTEILEETDSDLIGARENIESILLTFKNINAKDLDSLSYGLHTCFNNNFYIKNEEQYEEYKKRYVFDLPNNATKEAKLDKVFSDFASFLNYLYQKEERQFVILIDEYDKILMDAATQEEHENGYFNKVVNLYRNFLNSLLKDTVFIERAILTGVLPLAANSVFSAFNNSVKDTFLNVAYEDIFGFTQDEMEKLTDWMHDEDVSLIFDTLDSYNSGKTNLINPWSALDFVKNISRGERKLGNGWVNTGSSDWIIYKNRLTNEELDEISNLLMGESITIPLNHELTYSDKEKDLSNFLTYAFYTGYLTFEESTNDTISLRIPNKEVLNAWLGNLNKLVSPVKVQFNWPELLENIKTNEESEKKMELVLTELLEECTSSWDLVDKENSYHMWILGIMSTLVGTHKIASNREAGKGRFDIAITPLSGKFRNYVFELKKSNSVTSLEQDVKKAIKQVKENNYYRFFDNPYDIVIIGIAAYKKNIKVSIESFTREELKPI